jgi:hypothetical protein
MAFRLLHQCGHNASWNFESLLNDGCGDGLIFSPVHQSMRSVEKTDAAVKARSFFDPQFYLPNSQKRKLKEYPFFPETISDGFVTSEFAALALQAAQQCVDFQVNQKFDRIVVPTRFIDQMKTTYIDEQEQYAVAPFLHHIDSAGYDHPVFLTLALTSHMIVDKGFLVSLLNWITGYPNLDGLYLIVDVPRDTKQIQSQEVLSAYLDALREIRESGLAVVASHLNTESVLLTLVEGCDLTFGAYENTRIFSVDKFVVTHEDRRGPRARLYVRGLLNWIHLSDAKLIQTILPQLWNHIHTPSAYSDTAMSAPVEPTFQSPLLYKHHFVAMSDQLNELRSLQFSERKTRLLSWLDLAQQAYNEIRHAGIQLDHHGSGGHIHPWTSVVNAL